MQTMKEKFLTRLAIGVAGVSMAVSAAAGGLPNQNPKTMVRYIDNYGTYAVVHLHRDVDNPLGCTGNDPYDDPDHNNNKIRSYVIDYSSAEGKALFVHLLAVAAARKRTAINASVCDTGAVANTGLPIVDSVDTRF